MMTLFMHWYTPLELAKRMGFYHSCQAIGSMMSGALQAAIMSTLDGHHGLAGWRWLFVINAIITVIWGFLGLVMLPDYPNNPNPRAFWFKRNDGELSMARLVRHNRAEPKPVSFDAVKRTFRGWTVYFVGVLYISTVLASYGYNYFSLFLKAAQRPDGSKRWTVEEVNVIPIGGSAINVVFVWIWALLSDALRTRWTLILSQVFIGLIPCIIMSIWTSHPSTTPDAAAYASYFISYVCLGTAPLIFAWLSDLIPQDPEVRSLCVGVAVAGYYAISAWSQVLVWPASQAPTCKFPDLDQVLFPWCNTDRLTDKYGWQSSIALWVLVLVMTCTLRFIDVRYLRPKREAFDAATYNHVDPSVIEGVARSKSVDRTSVDDGKVRPESGSKKMAGSVVTPVPTGSADTA